MTSSLESSSPVVSVIIPVFNRERFIRETIQSVLNQSWQDFELIAIDDGCTDGSRAILDSLGERVTVLEHPGRQNRGQSAAINLGLATARGRYIAVLDSDDYWLPEKLHILVGALESAPEFDIAYSNGWWVTEDGTPIAKMYRKDHVEQSEPRRILMDCYFALPSNAIVRRVAYQRAGSYDETLRTAQDHDMLIRLVEVGKVLYVDRELWAYRRHGASISKRAGERRWLNGLYIVEKAATRYPYPKKVLRHRRAVIRFRLAQVYFEQHLWLKAAWNAAFSALLNPTRALRVAIGAERVSSPHS